MSDSYAIFIPVAKGLEYLLEEELAEFGVKPTRLNHQGIEAEVSLSMLYKLCLSLRIGSRVLVRLFQAEVTDKQSLYQAAKDYCWLEHFNQEKSLKIDFRGQSRDIRNSMYGALLLKDGLCDYFMENTNTRPNIDKETPNILLFATLKRQTLNVYLDPIGHALHKRGYREKAGRAPIKETLAAALLKRAKFDKQDAEHYGLLDPCCGSGTLLIEGVMMALGIAPGLLRQHHNLDHWKKHNAPLYLSIRQELETLAIKAKRQKIAPFIGYDKSLAAINQAKENAHLAGLDGLIDFKQQTVQDFSAPKSLKKGLLISNPPYGERLDERLALIPIYEAIGKAYLTLPAGFDCALLSTERMLVKATTLRLKKKYAFFNGPLASHLYCLEASSFTKLTEQSTESPALDHPLYNRLVKNLKKLKRWQTQSNVECFRVYDADLPEYSAAIDLYQNYALIQEYRAPKNIPPEKAEARLLEILKVVPNALGVSEKNLILKQRLRQSGSSQYKKQSDQNQRLKVKEGSIQCIVNLHDYLDTGLFLDHRPLRCKFETKKVKNFLNLYCYTAVASLHAATTGATTTNVDLSKTYLNWAKDNFTLNKFNLREHHFINQDVEQYLENCQEKFELIFLDPPSFSNSKKTEKTLDVCRDHGRLIRLAMNCVTSHGTLYFSCNAKKFKLDESLSAEFKIRDITIKTIDKDFNPKKPPHVCFEIQSH